MRVSPSSRKPATPPGAPSVATPDILDYTDYRKFLSDYYKARKAADPRFSLRAFAKEAGFPSHGLLKYLMDGGRNLGQKSLVKLVPALGFNKDQARYFENLVLFNQARGLEAERLYFDRLKALSEDSAFRKLDGPQLQVLRTWYSAPIREMLNLRGFQGDPDWIARRLVPRIEAREARAALETLRAAGLIRRTANGYRQADPDITTEDEVKSFAVKSYHAEMLRLAARAIDEVPAKDRDVSSVCFAVREADWPRLKKQIQLLRRELRGFAAKPGEGDRIVQLNLQLFPLALGDAA